MSDISKSVIKKDHSAKMNGSAMYVCDLATEGMLFGRLLRSTVAHAKIKAVELPELPDGYYYVDHRDVTGANQVHVVLDDSPVFAVDTVEYIGDPIGMICGPDEREVNSLLGKIKVEYEELAPILDMHKSDVIFFDYGYTKGDAEKAFAEADKIYEDAFETGLQEHVYLETNGMVAECVDGKVTVHGSMQCPYYVNNAVIKATGLTKDQVQTKMDVTGGGFGGKEDYSSFLACQCAIASQKTGKPVRVIFDRREDIEVTSKRHPSYSVYKVAVKDGKVTAMDIEVLYNGGAYTTLSSVVLQRGIIGSSGVYYVENLKVHGRVVKTNTVPNGAFRGFGGPQTFFSVEMMMSHIAKELGRDSMEFKLANVAKQGETTSTNGIYHFPVPIPEMTTEIAKLSDIVKKREQYKNQTGRYRRGVGMSMVFHGAGFTGAGERDLIKAVVRLHKTTDGNVEILCAGTDMGQGLKTTLTKIVANELDLPHERIIIQDPDTDRVPDSGPTAASRSIMTVGELLRRAAIKLKAEWEDGKDQVVEERFKEPDFVIPFYLDTFQGDAYPTYSWAVYAIEVEVDTYTGLSKILGAWGSFDVGTPIDTDIVMGQMEGGFLQGIGYGGLEQMATDNKGRIRNNSFSDYIIPTSVDVPNMVATLHVVDYPLGPYGAKGAGELPLVGAPSAYVEAIEQALGAKLNRTPFSAEDTMTLLRKKVD